jgi:hypothetical protein
MEVDVVSSRHKHRHKHCNRFFGLQIKVLVAGLSDVSRLFVVLRINCTHAGRDESPRKKRNLHIGRCQEVGQVFLDLVVHIDMCTCIG